MKKALLVFFSAAILVSCNNATDGDPNTDTTKLIIDTGGLNDTATHINTNTGTQPMDSTPGKSDVRSSDATKPGSRSTTPGADTSKVKY